MALMIVGVCALALLNSHASEAAVAERSRALDLQQRAAHAVTLFAQLNGRLPCVADAAGIENCLDPASSGRLPSVTLGLPDPGFRQLSYTLGDHALGTDDAGRYQLLGSAIANNNLNVAPVLYLGATDLNFCQALGRPSGATDSSDSPAFTLSVNRLAAAVGFLPALVTSRSDLAARLDCSSRSALAGRSYPDVALAAGAMAMSMADWRAQLEILDQIQMWDVSQSLWFCINATMNTIKPYLKMSIGMAAYAAEGGTPDKVWKFVTPAVQIPIFALQVTAFVSNSSRYVANIVQGRRILSRAAEIENDANALYARIQNRSAATAAQYAQWRPTSGAAVPATQPVQPSYLLEEGPFANLGKEYVNALHNFYPIPGTTDMWKAQVNQPIPGLSRR